MSDEKYIPPSESLGDHAHTIARAGISMIPVFSGPAVELFSAGVSPPLRRRQQEWMESIAAGLRECERRQQCVVDELKYNEGFIDTVLQASQAAIRTSQAEKREALKNAVLNSALPSPPDEWHRAMFVVFIDGLTVWHLRLLRWFADPPAWYQSHSKKPREISVIGNLPQVIGEAFPELQNQSELVDQCVSDLQSRGLLTKFNFHTNMGGDGIYAGRATRLGSEFLAFIAAPTC